MNWQIPRALAVVFFAVLLALTPLTAYAEALSESEFASAMDKYLGSDENVAKVGDALENYFREKAQKERQNQAKAEEDQLEEQFKNPIEIEVGSSPTKGPDNAAVTVIEFSEFQCPFCKRGADTMDALVKEYPNDVKVVFKHLPLGFHPQAKPAARAALAAREQGKFWEYHDELFNNQKRLGDELYTELAKKLDLDMEKFKADYESGKFDEEIEADAALATKHGVRGTPGYFVNGVQVRGARPLPYFKTIVDRWLEKSNEG